MTKFEIDDDGFKTQMKEVPLWRLTQEIISNSFDETAVKNIQCKITEQDSDKIKVVIIDDGKGFKKISDIYTLYGDSYKRTDPNKSGRFNEGEKRFLAVAKEGYVETKDKRIVLTENDKITTDIPMRKGTEVSGIFLKKDFDKTTIENLVEQIKKIAVPQNKKLSINNENLPPKNLVKKFKANLYTVKSSGPKQKMVQEKRITNVFLYEKEPDESPIIYENGIPVQELQDKILWHVDVRQKIPQTTDRNVISDRYLHKLYSIITENTIDLIPEEKIGSNFISIALKNSNEQTAKKIFKKKYGTEQVMIRSTSDSEANERAESAGVHLISGSELDSDVRSNLKSIGAIKMAGQEYATDHFEAAKSVEPTEEMKKFAKVVKLVALDTIKKEIIVNFITTKNTQELAQYGGKTMTWNVARCGGKKAFDISNPTMIGIMVHELAHDRYGQHNGYAHLSHDYLHEMQRIAGIVGSKGIDYWLKK